MAARFITRLGSAASTLLLSVLLLVGVAGAFVALDEVLLPAAEPAASAVVVDAASASRDPERELPRVNPLGTGRVFMFFIDSLRHDVAVDPSIMPNLSRLRERSATARIITANDGVTVPALRAAFTGRDNFRVFGFVGNLIRGEKSLRSWFTQMREINRRVAVYSDSAFRQFAADITTYNSNKLYSTGASGDLPTQTAALRAAVTDYQSGQHDAVIFHMTHGDHVSHRQGVGDEAYLMAYRAIDELVAEVAAAIAPEDTLLVFGDHGHNERGTHAMGMDIPTIGLARGHGFAPGVDLGTMSITHLRYWFSWATSIRLEGDYDGGSLVAGLHAPAPISRAFARTSHVVANADDGPKRSSAFIVAMVIGALASLWLALQSGLDRCTPTWLCWSPRLSDGGRVESCLWFVGLALPLYSCAWSPRALYYAPALVAAFIVRMAMRSRGAAPMSAAPVMSPRLWALSRWCLPVVFACLLVVWGECLAGLRALIHCPGRALLWGTIALIWVAMAAATLRWQPRRVLPVMLAIVALATHPTIYRYGGVAMMQLLVIGALIVVHVQWLVERDPESTRAGQGIRARWAGIRNLPWGDLEFRHRVGRTILVGVIAIFVLQLFASPKSANFQFRRFDPLFVIGPSGLKQWVWASTAAKIALAFCLLRTSWLRWVCVAGAAGLGYVELTPAVRHDPSILWAVAVCAGLNLARVRNDVDGWVELRAVAGFVALHLGFCYAVRMGSPTFVYACAGQLGTVLALVSLHRLRLAPADTRAMYVLVCAGATAWSGWISFTWSFQRLEWAFLYDWMSTEQSLEWVFALFPVVVARHLLPLWSLLAVMRWTIVRHRATPSPSRDGLHGVVNTVASWSGLAVFAWICVGLGLGLHLPGSNIYLEAVQHCAVGWVLVAGLLLLRRGRS